MIIRRLAAVGLVVATAYGVACTDDPADGGGSSGTGAGGSGGAGAGGTGGSSDAGGLGPTANVRVANLVPGVTFDAFGPDLESRPVLAAEGIAYGTISDYFEVRINPISMAPIFVLWKSGDAPTPEQTFSMLLDDTPDRVRIDVRELDGEGEYASIIVSPVDPTPESTLAYRTLDETEADRGSATEANLRITTYLEDFPGGVAPGIAVDGGTCLFIGSTALGVLHSVPAGSFDLTVHDLQSASDCADTPPIATFPMDIAAGENELVVMYLDGGEARLVSAPLAPR